MVESEHRRCPTSTSWDWGVGYLTQSYCHKYKNRGQESGEGCSSYADIVGPLDGRAGTPPSRASLHASPTMLGLCRLSSLCNFLTALSVLGQDANSWSSRVQSFQFAQPVFSSEPPPWGAESQGGKKSAEGGWALLGQIACPRYPSRDTLLAPHLGPEPHSITVPTSPLFTTHPTRRKLPGKDTE